MTVQQLFEEEKIDLEMIEEKIGESSYWEGASSFIFKVWEKELSELSLKQVEWTHLILESMIEYRIKNRPPAGMRSGF